jgi:hypothetical protein
MIIKEKTSGQKNRFYYKTIDRFNEDDLEIKEGRKIQNKNFKKPTSTRCEERNRIIAKGGKIIIAIFIVSFSYSLGFLIKDSQTTPFESIILSLLISSSITFVVGLLIGKYLTRQSDTKLQ